MDTMPHEGRPVAVRRSVYDTALLDSERILVSNSGASILVMYLLANMETLSTLLSSFKDGRVYVILDIEVIVGLICIVFTVQLSLRSTPLSIAIDSSPWATHSNPPLG